MSARRGTAAAWFGATLSTGPALDTSRVIVDSGLHLHRVEPAGYREVPAIVCTASAGARSVASVSRSPLFPADDEARGTRLHDLRVSLDLGLREAAFAIGVIPADLSAIERGELRPCSGFGASESGGEREIERRLRTRCSHCGHARHHGACNGGCIHGCAERGAR